MRKYEMSRVLYPLGVVVVLAGAAAMVVWRMDPNRVIASAVDPLDYRTIEGRLERPRVDEEQQVSAFHDRPFVELHRGDVAGDARPHNHRLHGLEAARDRLAGGVPTIGRVGRRGLVLSDDAAPRGGGA